MKPSLVFRAVAVALIFHATAWAAELASGGAGGVSFEPSIGGDGRFVVFTSRAKLSPEDTTSTADVYVRDLHPDPTGVPLRLVSDNRGGDQPSISANGRFVIFRALDTFPKIRVVDLDTQEPPRTISYPDNGFSFHYADSATISPEGRFIGFPFRPIPGFTNQTQAGLVINDTTFANRLDDDASVSITEDFFNPQFRLDSVGRVAMTRDGFRVFIETRDDILSTLNHPNVDNGTKTKDIYMLDRGGGFARLSAADGGPDEKALTAKDSARDPVLTGDGNIVFFISERMLHEDDKDKRATIYRSAPTVALPVPIPTPGVRPLALSRQPTGDGQYVVFLGQTAAGDIKPYVLRVNDGMLLALAASGDASMTGPAISANNAFIAFATNNHLVADDRNGQADVYVTPNPFTQPPFVDAPLPTPAVSLPPPAQTEITAGTQVSLSASASVTSGSIVYTAIEVDGVVVKQSTNGTVASANYTLARGAHQVRAVALSNANVPGRSAEIAITVKPSNALGVRGVKDLLKNGLAGGGAIDFSGTLQIDNTTAAAKSIRVLLTEASNNSDWEFFGGGTPATRPEQVLDILSGTATVTTTPVPSSPLELAFSGVTRPPELVSTDGFQGVGYTILARLQEQTGPSAWTDRDTFTIFQIRPRLDEETPGPNGGTPVLDSANSDGNFNPTQVTSVAVSGPALVAERTSRVFTASATFNSGTKPVTPKWSLSAGAPAVISTSGFLSAGHVTRLTAFTLTATFGGKQGQATVMVRPVPPTVSVLAPVKFVAENDPAGTFFRILRTPITNELLDVSYTVSGLANNPQRSGTDYTALSGTATIQAGASSVKVPLLPMTDGLIEGDESVIVTLSPAGEYRLSARSTATITIDDNDDEDSDGNSLLPNTVPDATIRRGNRAVVGAKVYTFGDDSLAPTIASNAVKGRPVDFTIGLVNRSNGNETFSIDAAGADFNGFTVRYFLAGQDVTTVVENGTVQLNGANNVFAPGTGVNLKMRITATAAAPLGATFPCLLRLQAQGGFSDTVQALVKRVR